MWDLRIVGSHCPRFLSSKFYLSYLRKKQNKKKRKHHLVQAGIHPGDKKKTLFFQYHQETKLSLGGFGSSGFMYLDRKQKNNNIPSATTDETHSSDARWAQRGAVKDAALALILPWWSSLWGSDRVISSNAGSGTAQTNIYPPLELHSFQVGLPPGEGSRKNSAVSKSWIWWSRREQGGEGGSKWHLQEMH